MEVKARNLSDKGNTPLSVCCSRGVNVKADDIVFSKSIVGRKLAVDPWDVDSTLFSRSIVGRELTTADPWDVGWDVDWDVDVVLFSRSIVGAKAATAGPSNLDDCKGVAKTG
jgi:hypothetical protein